MSLGARNEVHLCVRSSAEVNLTGWRARQDTEPLADHGVYLAWSSRTGIVHMSAEEAAVIRQVRFKCTRSSSGIYWKCQGSNSSSRDSHALTQGEAGLS